MPRYRFTDPETGKSVVVKSDTPLSAEEQVQAASQVFGKAGSRAPRAAESLTPEEIIARGILGSGFGTQAFATPEHRVGRAAFVARVAPGLIPIPVLSAAASAVGEGVAQAAEVGVGSRKGIDPMQIGLAAAVPPAAAGAIRVARGIGRTFVRTVPSLFRVAHERAAGAAEDVARQLTPEIPSGLLFRAARAAGDDIIPAGRIRTVLDDLDQSLPKAPADPGLKVVRESLENIRGAIQGDQINLAELMRHRLDLGRLIARRGSAPELRAIYGHGGKGAKGILGALEQAAEQSGAGAALAQEALTVFKRDLGVAKWKDLIEAATKRTSISGADVPALNVATLANAVNKNADELRGLIGPEGMNIVGTFIREFRSLPPTHALTMANVLVAGMLGAGGGFVGGPAGLAGGLVARELGTNIWQVARNPAALNQALTTVAQTVRAAAETPERFRTPLSGLRIGGKPESEP